MTLTVITSKLDHTKKSNDKTFSELWPGPVSSHAETTQREVKVLFCFVFIFKYTFPYFYLKRYAAWGCDLGDKYMTFIRMQGDPYRRWVMKVSVVVFPLLYVWVNRGRCLLPFVFCHWFGLCHQQEHWHRHQCHWHQQEHQGLGCVTTHWHQQEYQGYFKTLLCAA